MSTTVSIGVWSVTVIGAISKIFFNLSGVGWLLCVDVVDVNNTTDCPLMPSIKRFALPTINKTFKKLDRSFQ